MCADKVVDLDEVDKDSIRMTRGKIWTTQGKEHINLCFRLVAG